MENRSRGYGGTRETIPLEGGGEKTFNDTKGGEL
jgi:hypothetical protein